MKGGRTAGGGSRVRPMAGGSARGPRVRVSMPVPGATALRFWVCTHGPVGTTTRAPGRRVSGMVSEWRARAAGSTEGNGHRGSKVATGSWRGLLLDYSFFSWNKDVLWEKKSLYFVFSAIGIFNV